MSRLAIAFLLLTCCLFSLGSMMERGYIDTKHLTVKKFDEKHLSEYRHEKAFDYETEPEKGEGLAGIIAYLWGEFIDFLGTARVGKISLFDVLFYGLIVFAAVMIVMQFFKVEISGFFSNSNTQIITHQSYTENVHELDFDTAIQSALQNGDYRLATRLYYLSILKKLSDAGLINWQKNKTNFEYYYELKGEERRRQFYNLTRIFESAWYGNLEITATAFDENQKAFNGFLQIIQR